jgi:hypothetical protein
MPIIGAPVRSRRRLSAATLVILDFSKAPISVNEILFQIS